VVIRTTETEVVTVKEGVIRTTGAINRITGAATSKIGVIRIDISREGTGADITTVGVGAIMSQEGAGGVEEGEAGIERVEGVDIDLKPAIDYQVSGRPDRRTFSAVPVRST
jgi:hypothetical protein